jgi:hypothetical protein
VGSVGEKRECSVAACLSILKFDVKSVITRGIGLQLFLLNLGSVETENPSGNVSRGPASLGLVKAMCQYSYHLLCHCYHFQVLRYNLSENTHSN